MNGCHLTEFLHIGEIEEKGFRFAGEKQAVMKMLVRALMFLTLLGQANADIFNDIFDPPAHFKGTVSYVQPNHFVLVSPQAEYLRLFVKIGQFVPSTITPGMVVECTARQDETQVWRIESIDGVQTPAGDMVPVFVPGAVNP